ncbi:MAG TPA: recombinase family protein [Candidatus Saccharimonadales bacterium]
MKLKSDMPITYAMYVRKSTEGDDRQVHSIDDQIEVLTDLAKRYDINIRPRDIYNESRSARKPDNRPEFDRLIESIQSGKIQGIVVWKLDRLSRNPTESGLLQQLLQDGKIRHIRTPEREYYPQDNAVVFSVETSIGNQYVRDLSTNVKRGMRAAARNGRIAGVAPAGYINRQVDERKFIEKDQERWLLIRKAFDVFLSGNYTVMEVREMLDEWGYISYKRSPTSKRGGKPISRSSLYSIFNNRRYMGKVPQPDYPDDPDHDADGDFEPMITQQEFDRVQSLLGNKTRVKNVSQKFFELKGLLRCGHCDCAVTAHVVPKKLKDGTINYHTYYHCTRKKGPCSQKGLPEAKLFAQIDELLGQYEISPKLYEWGLTAIKDIAKGEIAQRDDVQQIQFATIDELQKQLDKLVDLVTDSVISSDTYKRKAEPLEAELAKRQQDQQNTAERVKNWYEIIGFTLERLNNATENFKTGDLNTRRDILLAIGYNPTLLNKTISIDPNPWLIPIKDSLPEIKAELSKVETVGSIKKNKSSLDREQSLVSLWCSIWKKVFTPLEMSTPDGGLYLKYLTESIYLSSKCWYLH